MKKKNYENYKNLNKTMNIKMLIAFILGAIISITSSYVIAETLINSEDVSYVDNAKLGATNVQAAIDGTCTKFSNDLATLLDKMYPVGSIYISTKLSTPAQVGSAIGGTWESYGKGQTLVGIDTSQKEFETVSKTGGSKSNSYTPSGSIGSTGLTIDQIPSHTHTYDKANANTDPHKLTIEETPNELIRYFYADEGVWSLGTWSYHGAGHAATMRNQTGYGDYNKGHTHPISTTSTPTGAAGKGTTSDGHTHTFTGTATTLNNLQPYITVYMYRRTE